LNREHNANLVTNQQESKYNNIKFFDQLFDKNSHSGIKEWKDFYTGVDNIKESQIDSYNHVNAGNLSTYQQTDNRSKQTQFESDDSNIVIPSSTLKEGPLRFKKLKNSLESILDNDPIIGLDLAKLNSS